MIITIVGIIAAILVCVIILRLYLANQAKKMSEEIAMFSNIIADFEQRFHDYIIATSEKIAFIAPYKDAYNRAVKLSKWLDRLHVNTTEEIVHLINDYESIDSIVKKHNKQVEHDILERNKEFFNTCLKYPLDLQQRKSIIAEEDNVLVVSSAGSGKTSSIVGKVKYLTQIKNYWCPLKMQMDMNSFRNASKKALRN